MRKHDPSRSSLTPLTYAADARPDENSTYGERSLQDDGLKRMGGMHLQDQQYPQQFPHPSLASPSSLSKESRPPAHATAAIGQSTTTSTNRFGEQDSEPIRSERTNSHLWSSPSGQQLSTQLLPYTSEQYPPSISPTSSVPHMAHQDYPSGLLSHSPMQASYPSYGSFRSAPGNGMIQGVGIDGNAAYGHMPAMMGSGYPTIDGARHDARRVSSTGTTAASQYWSCADLNPGQVHLSSSSATSGRGGSTSSSWDSRPHTAEEASNHSVLYGGDSSGTASEVSRDFHITPLHERGWSSSSYESASPGLYSGGGFEDREPLSSGSTRLTVPQHSLSSSSTTRGGSAWSSSPTLDGGEWTAERKKRPRRKFSEIDRMYKCAYRDCDRGYGTLNHLNAHVALQNHGPKRTAEEFREVRREWRARRKEEMRAREREEAEQGSTHHTARHHSALVHEDRNHSSPRTLRLPQASISRPRGNTSSAGSSNLAKQPMHVRPGRSASGPTPISGTGGDVMLSPYAGSNPGGAGIFPSLPSSISTGSSWSSQGSAPGTNQGLPRMPPTAYHFPMPLNLPGPEPPASGSVAPHSIAMPSTGRPDHLSANTLYQQDRGGPNAEHHKGDVTEAERYQIYTPNAPLRDEPSSGGWDGGRFDFAHNSSGRRA